MRGHKIRDLNRRSKEALKPSLVVQKPVFATIKRKKLKDPLKVEKVIIPPLPLPISWGKMIKPFNPNKKMVKSILIFTKVPTTPALPSTRSQSSQQQQQQQHQQQQQQQQQSLSEQSAPSSSPPRALLSQSFPRKLNLTSCNSPAAAAAASASNVPEQNYYYTSDVLKFFDKHKSTYEVLLIDPPYDVLGPAQLQQLPIKDIVRKGYIFIWIDKEFIPDIHTWMERNKFVFVESFIWVKTLTNNKFCMEEYPLFQKSKLALHIFKRDNAETKKIPIQHQRNPDVYFDFVRGERDRPEFVYQMIETMLPKSVENYKCMDLWGKRNEPPREGWVKVVDGRV